MTAPLRTVDTGTPAVGLMQSFARASANLGVAREHRVLAGRSIDLCFAGSALEARLAPALANPSVPVSQPALRVFAWTSSERPPLPALLPAQPRPGDPPGTRWRYQARSFTASWWPHHGLLMAHDADTHEAWWWTGDLATVPWWEFAAPMRPILHWWAAGEGLLLLHAAAVGTTAGGALIAGPSGAGKSTLALACLGGSLQLAGDDYVLLDALADGFHVHSLYATAKVDPGGTVRVAALQGRPLTAPDVPGAKLAVHLARDLAVNVAAGFPVRAIVAPRITDSTPRLTSISRAAALRALAPSTLLQLGDGDLAGAFDVIARLAARLPAYGLDTGPDPARAAALVAGMLTDG